ncbi:MAG TPA: hypothetical protein VNA69_07555 [Thermoanaerobaculia bacterium]|nr:hypothetical protein [Thermoanaerobaculia bacterium]
MPAGAAGCSGAAFVFERLATLHVVEMRHQHLPFGFARERLRELIDLQGELPDSGALDGDRVANGPLHDSQLVGDGCERRREAGCVAQLRRLNEPGLVSLNFLSLTFGFLRSASNPGSVPYKSQVMF